MKKLLFLLLMACVTVPSIAQKDNNAKSILDRTYAAFKDAGGIKAKFSVRSYKGGKTLGASKGSIQLKGTKFLLKTNESTIWFDGKTQWNYVYKNQEVNVSNPTTAELQNINPYYILSIYQRGFNYKMGPESKFGGKSANQIILSAQSSKNSISNIVIYVSTANDEPLSISITRKDGTKNDLKISGYQINQNFSDAMFTFNKKKYSKVEVVDLR
jgi:outer membrane lipoprotein-sorting protein